MATLTSADFTANVATLLLTNTTALQNARALCLNIAAGAVSAAGTINVPAIQKPYIVINGSSFAVTVKVSGQTGVAVPAGKRTVVYNNGTDVGSQIDWLAALEVSGNLGVGVTPSAWSGTNTKALDISLWTSLANGNAFGAALTFNGYYNGTSWIYKQTNTASKYETDGVHRWYTAPSGTAGNPITFTQAMTLDASGNLGLGIVPSAGDVYYEKFELGKVGCGLVAANASLTGSELTYFTSNAVATYTGANPWTYGNAGAAGVYSIEDGVHIWNTASSGTAGAAITFTQAMVLDASGNLLVGLTSGSTNIFRNDRNNDQTLYIQNNNASAPFGLYINYPNAAPNGTGSWFISCRDSGTNRMQVYSNGGIANFSGNDVNLSDRREKTNFAPAGSYLAKICAIPVQTFNYIDQNMKEDPGLTLGVVAQDVQAVAPELVLESNWGTQDEPKQRLSIYQTDMQYALMKCIQEQQAIITALTARVAALEAK